MTYRLIKLLAVAGSALCLSATVQAESVNFGDDYGDWANDGECDDPRFVGVGMTATPLLDADTFHDASDCRAAHNKGLITLRAAYRVDFGNNSSTWANDGECDDPRFIGTGMTGTALLDEDAYADANDCRAAYNRGAIRLR